MRKLSPLGKFHVIKVQSVYSKPGVAVPVLYLQCRDGTIFIHEQFHEYVLANPNSSMTWKKTRARALGLFWDFTQSINGIAPTLDPINMHRTIFRLFCQALQFGTIQIETKLDDQFGLYWPSTNKHRTKELISGLQAFITWVCNESAGTDSPFALSSLSKLSDQDKAAFPRDSSTSTRFLIIAHKLKHVSFFAHLKDASSHAARLQQEAERQIYNFGINTSCQFNVEPAVYMDPEIIAAMLEYGFVKNPDSKVPHVREDLTAKMVFLLLSFGGCRLSEPFHLWFNDVIVDLNKRCKIFLRHPEEAETFFHGERGTRREYLAKINLLPRNTDYTSRAYHAGWKNLSTDKSHCAPIFWLHDGADALFTGLYLNYLRYRSCLIEQRLQRGLPDHPFLFVSTGEDRNSGISKVGDPYSMKAFSKVWDQALKRVSMALGRQIIKKKENGTTEHAPRHFYGQVLSDAAAHPKMIQRGLRQRSVLSQATYTQPDYNKINAELQVARKKIEGGHTALDLSKINNTLAVLSDTHFVC